MRQPVTDDRNLIPTRPQIDIHDDFISMFNERHGETFTTRDGCKTVRIVTRETRVSQGFARIVQGQCLLPDGVPRNAVQKMGSLKSKKVISQKTSNSCIK